MEAFFPDLFKPSQIGKIRLHNCIVMAPMTTYFAHTNGEVSDALIAHYVARARGGVGLIIVEAASVRSNISREGLGQLHISHPRFVPGLNRLNEAIHAYGSRTFIQLSHPGRQTNQRLYGGEQPVAPSALACPMMKAIPRELSPLEVEQTINEFVAAAHCANLAGFDGIELHAAHGYLINQFLSPHTNRRQDEYGGSLQNRQRFLLEIVNQIKKELPDLVLAVRLNIDDFVPGGLEPADSLQVCRFLERAGVDVINCSSGTYESGLTSIEPASYAEGWRVYLAEEVKKVVNIPVITGGMLRNPAFANQVLKEQRADFIFLGRPLLADPEWANKARQNRTADIRPCVSCNTCIARMFAGLGSRCAVNPFTGRENILVEADVLKHSARAVVIGGGPAGIQAALSLQRHGLKVTLYEKQARLGGLMNLAGVPPHKEKVAELRDFMVRDLARSGVQVVLNQEIGLESLEAIQPDILIVATGSQAVHPTIRGEQQGLGVEASEVLGGQVVLTGQAIVIIGGGTTGCELADYLLNRGKQVTILEKGPVLAADMERKNRRALLNRLIATGLVQKTGVKVMEIMPHQVRFASSGQEELLAAEHIVWAAGFKPQDELFAPAQAMIPRVFLIGDAGQVRGFSEAILEGEMIGNTVVGLLN